MKDMLEQIYDELNAQVIRMLEHARKQSERIAELERENSSLAYELNVALSGSSVAIPSSKSIVSTFDKDSEYMAQQWADTVKQCNKEVPDSHKIVPIRPNWNMLDALYGKGWIEKSPEEQVGMVQAYRNMLDAAALNLPAAPIQQEGASNG